MFVVRLLVCLGVVTCACGAPASVAPPTSQPPVDSSHHDAAAAFDAAFQDCIDTCLETHCADDIGGGCSHVCNLDNYGEVKDPLGQMRRIAEEWAAKEFCPFVDVTEGPTPSGLLVVGRLECRGSSACGDDLLDQAAAVGANLITEYRCQLSAPEGEGDAPGPEGVFVPKDCFGNAVVDPARKTFEPSR